MAARSCAGPRSGLFHVCLLWSIAGCLYERLQVRNVGEGKGSQNLWPKRGPAGLQGPWLLSGRPVADHDPCASVTNASKRFERQKKDSCECVQSVQVATLDWHLNTAELPTLKKAYLSDRRVCNLGGAV